MMANNHYQPLFLKYRPQKLEDILGQNSVKDTLINAIKNSKIVHAYLLTGPRGSGKTSTARILAKSLNCLQPIDGLSPTVSPCGTCQSCLGIINSSSTDVVEIDAASHGGVDDARRLIEKVNLASIAGKYRIYIIDEVHMLTKEAFNALLKTIEEPPANVVFILATTEVDKVPKTIASRCQQLRFKPITINDCCERLNFVVTKEGININDEVIRVIADHSDGAMRDALSLLDQLSVFSNKTDAIDINRVLEILGTVALKELNELVTNILKRNPQALLEQIDQLLAAGRDALLITKELTNYFLTLLEANNGLEIKASYAENLQELIALLKTEKIENFEIVQIIDSLTELENKIKQSGNSKNLFKAWLVKICYRADILVVKDLLARIEALENGSPVTASKPVAARVPEQAIPKPQVQAKPIPVQTFPKVEVVQAEPQVQSSVKASGEAFLDYLSPGSRGMYVSSQARFVEVKNGTAFIQMPVKFKFLKTKLEARKEEIQSAIEKSLGTIVQNMQVDVADEIVATAEASKEPLTTQAQAEPSKAQEPESSPYESTELSNQNLKLDEVVGAGLNFFGGKEIK